MTDAEQLALAQHVIASQCQAQVALVWLQREGDTVTVPRAWIAQWITQSREALGQLRRSRGGAR